MNEAEIVKILDEIGIPFDFSELCAKAMERYASALLTDLLEEGEKLKVMGTENDPLCPTEYARNLAISAYQEIIKSKLK